jgi:gliding motility associated protien GldN
MKKILALLVLVASLNVANAQENTVLDGIYVKENFPSRKVIPYTHLREADVMWNKRVWRKIDVKEKINHPLYYPINDFAQGRKNLFDVMKDAILNEGTITAYSPGLITAPNDMFTEPLTPEEVKEKLVRKSEKPDYDEFGEVIGYKTIEDPVDARKITSFQIKEEWFFDKQRSVLDVRIIGIMPIVEQENDAGEISEVDLFWVYFPEARFVFANAEVFNRQNDAERRTYEDIFWKRQFSSRITKVSNVYDRRIQDYKTGLDALLESEKLKEEVFNFEHDLWEF